MTSKNDFPQLETLKITQEDAAKTIDVQNLGSHALIACREITHADQEKILYMTPREFEVLRARATGMNHRKISSRMKIKPDTVASHISRVINTLNVRSSGEAATFIPMSSKELDCYDLETEDGTSGAVPSGIRPNDLKTFKEIQNGLLIKEIALKYYWQESTVRAQVYNTAKILGMSRPDSKIIPITRLAGALATFSRIGKAI